MASHPGPSGWAQMFRVFDLRTQNGVTLKKYTPACISHTHTFTDLPTLRRAQRVNELTVISTWGFLTSGLEVLSTLHFGDPLLGFHTSDGGFASSSVWAQTRLAFSKNGGVQRCLCFSLVQVEPFETLTASTGCGEFFGLQSTTLAVTQKRREVYTDEFHFLASPVYILHSAGKRRVKGRQGPLC